MARMLSCLVTVLMVMQGGDLSSAEHLCNCTRGTWRQIDGALKHVSVGRGGVWGVSNSDNIYYRVGSYDDEANTGDTWVQIYGGLKQVDVGHNVVWGVSSDDNIYYRQGITASTPDGTSWPSVPGAMKHVSVSQKGHVWGVNTDDNIFHRSGASNCNVPGNAWQDIDGQLKQISVGSGEYGASTPAITFSTEKELSVIQTRIPTVPAGHVPGLLKYISSSDMIYGVNSGDAVFYRQGVSAGTPIGTDWQVIDGSLKQIEFLSLAVWGSTPEITFL